MIEITETQNKVLEAYLANGTYRHVGKQIGLSFEKVVRISKQLYASGVIRQRGLGEGGKGPILTGNPYKVVTTPAKTDIDGPADNLIVRITPDEEAWLRKHYKKYRHNRSEVAKMLGRTRYEINAIVLQLGVGRRY